MSASSTEQIPATEEQELLIRPKQLDSENDWLAEADVLANQLKSVSAAHVEIRFAIGDWLNRYALRDSVYNVGEEKFRKPRAQLVDFASTARRMPVALRTFKVSFNHYRVVANNAKLDRFTYWLEYAQNFHFNCEDLRHQILTGSDKTAKISVVISADAYKSLENVAKEFKSTVPDLASAWLQEKIQAERDIAYAIACNNPPPDIRTPSAFGLQKLAEQAEREKQAEELHDAKFPKLPVEEFKRLWITFLDTVYTVRQAERRKQAEADAEKSRKQAEAQAEKARQYDAGLQLCRTFGLVPRDEARMQEAFNSSSEEMKNKLLDFAFDRAYKENSERAAVKVADPGSVSAIS